VVFGNFLKIHCHGLERRNSLDIGWSSDCPIFAPIHKDRVWVLSLLFVLITSACGKSDPVLEKSVYKYVGPDSRRVVTFDLRKKEVDNGHRVFTIKSCDQHSFRVCLYGETTLAIPNGQLKKGDTWEVAGSKFLVASIDSNERAEYLIVSEPPSGEKLNIFFNETSGIWGLKLSGEQEIYKSADPCGLGCSIRPGK
jgi:hypothetical protein